MVLLRSLPGAGTRNPEGGYLPDIRPPEEVFRDVTDAKTPKNLFLSNIFRLFFQFSTKFPPYDVSKRKPLTNYNLID